MKTKIQYEEVQVEVSLLNKADVITTSSGAEVASAFDGIEETIASWYKR